MPKDSMLATECRLGKPLSPAVYAFAVAMQEAIDEDRNKGYGWTRMSKYEISSELRHNVEALDKELVKANVVHLNPRRIKVTEAAAEVANACLFLSLTYGRLIQKDLA